MLLNRKLTPKTVGFGFWVLVIFTLTALPGTVAALDYDLDFQQDTIPLLKDTLHYPIHDRRGDYLTNDYGTSIDLKKPSNITDSIAYDPETRRYIVYEKIGNRFYRTPTWYTSEEFMAIQGRKAEV